MQRRKYLAATAALLGSAGCLGGRVDEAAPTTTTASDQEATRADHGEPTVRTTATPDLEAKEVLAFGEWYTAQHWAIAVDDVTTATSFTDDFSQNGGRHEMPADQQLLFASLRLKNIAQEERYELSPTVDPWFAAVADGTIYESTGSFDHPDYDDSVDMDWLQRPGDRIGGTERVSSGATIDRWTGHVVPRDVEVANVQVAYDASASEEFGIRWQKK